MRFSNGAPVRPEDVRASIERMLACRRPGPRARRHTCRHSRAQRGVSVEALRSLEGDRDRRGGADRDHPSEPARRRVPAQAPRSCSSCRPAARRTSRDARAPGHGPVHDQALGPAARRVAGPQPAVPDMVARSARRIPRQDRVPDRPVTSTGRRRGTRRRGRRAAPSGTRQVAPSCGRGTAHACTPIPPPGGSRTCSSTSAPRRSTTLASGGRSTTPSIAAASPSSRHGGDARADLPDAAAGHPGLHALVPFTVEPEPRGHVDRPGPGKGAPARRRLRDARHEGRVLGEPPVAAARPLLPLAVATLAIAAGSARSATST